MKRILFALVSLFTFTLSPMAAQEMPALEPITVDNVRQLEQIRVLGRGTVNVIAERPDSDLIAIGSGTGVYLYDSADTEIAHLSSDMDNVRDLAWSADGTQLASASTYGDSCWIRIWSISEDGTANSMTAEFPLCSRDIAWSPAGRWLAAEEFILPTFDNWPMRENKIFILDTATVQTVGEIAHEENPFGIRFAWSPDGHYLASATFSELQVWDNESRQEIGMFHHDLGIRDLMWSQNSRYIDAFCYNNEHYRRDWEMNSCRFDPETGALVWMEEGVSRMPSRWDTQRLTLPNYSTSVSSLAWNFDGTQLAANYVDSMLAIRPNSFKDGFDQITLEAKPQIMTWGSETFTEENSLTLQNEEVNRVEWASDGSNIITETTEIRTDDARRKRAVSEQVRIWDSTNGSLQQTLLDIERDTNFFQALAFAWNSDYQHLAYNDGTSTVFIDGEAFITVDYGTVLELLWSPDDKLLGVVHGVSDYYLINTVEIRTGEPTMTVVGPDYYVLSWAWSPDASKLAVVSPWLNGSGTDFTVRVYDTLAGEEYWGLPEYNAPLFQHHDRIQFPPEMDSVPPVIAWNPTSDLLAIGNVNSITVYDFGELRYLHGEKAIASLPAFEVTALDWSPDGTMIAAGSNDGTVRLYGVHVESN